MSRKNNPPAIDETTIVRILIIEDHRDIAENVGDYLSSRGHSLDFASDGVAGLSLAQSNDYDAIVLDLMLPRMDGITVCRRLRDEAKKNTPVLMLTARDKIANKVEGFEAGADDYLVKPFSMKELLVRLNAMHRRHNGFTMNNTLHVADLIFDLNTMVAKRNGVTINLNPTMRTLLTVLMKNTHRVVSRGELEYALWAEDPPDKDVLRAHIHSLRTMIDKPFSIALIKTVHGIGYRLEAPE